ncbi:MAG TPA: hypothetical protein VIV60_07135 [Polyangiaceae bacterium]
MTDAEELFEEVVARTGLASFIGPGVVKRALQSVGVYRIEDATREDYRQALPVLRARMATYLSSEPLDARLRDIGSLLRLSSFPGARVQKQR